MNLRNLLAAACLAAATLAGWDARPLAAAPEPLLLAGNLPAGTTLDATCIDPNQGTGYLVYTIPNVATYVAKFRLADDKKAPQLIGTAKMGAVTAREVVFDPFRGYLYVFADEVLSRFATGSIHSEPRYIDDQFLVGQGPYQSVLLQAVAFDVVENAFYVSYTVLAVRYGRVTKYKVNDATGKLEEQGTSVLEWYDGEAVRGALIDPAAARVWYGSKPVNESIANSFVVQFKTGSGPLPQRETSAVVEDRFVHDIIGIRQDRLRRTGYFLADSIGLGTAELTRVQLAGEIPYADMKLSIGRGRPAKQGYALDTLNGMGYVLIRPSGASGPEPLELVRINQQSGHFDNFIAGTLALPNEASSAAQTGPLAGDFAENMLYLPTLSPGNARLSIVPIPIPRPGGVDLGGRLLRAAALPTQYGPQIRSRLRLTNHGDSPSGTIIIYMVLSRDAELDYSDTVIGVRELKSLAPRRTRTVRLNSIPLTRDHRGQHLLAVFDVYNRGRFDQNLANNVAVSERLK